VFPLADAVNKLATDMMVSSEYHAAPRRWATGVEIPNPVNPQYERLQEDVKRVWSEAETGKFLLGGPGVSMGQFPAAALDNFVSAIGMLTGQIAAIAGLPPHYLGISTQNPASAEAIRSAEASLVQRAESKQRLLGGSWERVMRLAVLVRDGEVPPAAHGMETIWRDTKTPTIAQAADAAVKLVGAGIIPWQQAQEDLGYTPVQRERMAKDRADEIALARDADTQVRVELATKLMTEQGMSKDAALKAVGLTGVSEMHILERATGTMPGSASGSVPAGAVPPIPTA
jgi:hypothetical protein